ncbi:MAG: GntR family transcriptional regulator [Bacillota bacterium]|nr:GntR family transcriptional regulator [Bacillota bacterium]
MKGVSYKAPIYLQLREVIRNKIESGEYKPSITIPSEKELADTYGINRLTVRNAIDALVKEGLLKRVHGKGIYVMNNKVNRDLETLAGFSQTMHEKNKRAYVKVRVKLLRLAGEKYGYIFGISPEEKLFCIKRTCFADDEPVSLEEVLIPFKVLPELEKIDVSVFSMYEIYKFYNIEITKAYQTVDLVRLDAKEAKLLGVERDSSVMLFESISYNQDNEVIEYSKNYTRGDHCDFIVHYHGDTVRDEGAPG